MTVAIKLRLDETGTLQIEPCRRCGDIDFYYHVKGRSCRTCQRRACKRYYRRNDLLISHRRKLRRDSTKNLNS